MPAAGQLMLWKEGSAGDAQRLVQTGVSLVCPFSAVTAQLKARTKSQSRTKGLNLLTDFMK